MGLAVLLACFHTSPKPSAPVWHLAQCRRKPSAALLAFAAQAAFPCLLQHKGSRPELPVAKAAGWTTLT